MRADWVKKILKVANLYRLDTVFSSPLDSVSLCLVSKNGLAKWLETKVIRNQLLKIEKTNLKLSLCESWKSEGKVAGSKHAPKKQKLLLDVRKH